MLGTYCPKKIINDVTFETKCGSLNRMSRKVTEPEVIHLHHTVPYPQCPASAANIDRLNMDLLSKFYTK